MNLLDGLDGLAAGVGLLALATFAILSYQQQDWMTFGICLAFIGGILGFLYFNYHPASIFMGDTGSLFLGFLMDSLEILNPWQVDLSRFLRRGETLQRHAIMGILIHFRGLNDEGQDRSITTND